LEESRGGGGKKASGGKSVVSDLSLARATDRRRRFPPMVAKDLICSVVDGGDWGSGGGYDGVV